MLHLLLKVEDLLLGDSQLACLIIDLGLGQSSRSLQGRRIPCVRISCFPGLLELLVKHLPR